MDSWILRLCRYSAKKRLKISGLFAAVAILALAVSAAAGWRYFSNFALGPYNESAADLEHRGSNNNGGRYFVRVAGTEAIDAGQESNSYGVPEGGHYYGIRIGEQFLLVKHVETTALAFEGVIEPLPPDRRVFLMRSKASKLMSQFYPLYLDADTDFRLPGYFSIPAAVVLISILALSLKRAGRAWLELRNPKRHRIYRRISTWGSAPFLCGEIENEYRSKVEMRKFGAVFTENYLIWEGSPFFDIFRFRDLLWAYKKVTTHRVNFIPVGKSHRVRLVFRDEPASFMGTEKEIDDLLAYLKEKAPWAIIGYSHKLEKSYRNDPKGFSANGTIRLQQWLRDPTAKQPRGTPP
jgi:hypothetical protein